MRRFKSRTVVVEIDGPTRDVSMNDDTQLVDRNGSVRAVGTKAIKAALVAGTKVLVTWKPFWVADGSGAVTGYYLDAETVRMITVSPLDEKNALTVKVKGRGDFSGSERSRTQWVAVRISRAQGAGDLAVMGATAQKPDLRRHE